MDIQSRTWSRSSIVLVLAGILLVGTGSYFIILRPPLLPEDTRFMGVAAAQLDPIRPQLEAWLTNVFWVLGGYILATGVLTVTLAATSIRQHSPIAGVGALLGGAASIGWMAAVNFKIGSDFKWVLLAMALVWACGLALFAWESRQNLVMQPAPSDGKKSHGNA